MTFNYRKEIDSLQEQIRQSDSICAMSDHAGWEELVKILQRRAQVQAETILALSGNNASSHVEEMQHRAAYRCALLDILDAVSAERTKHDTLLIRVKELLTKFRSAKNYDRASRPGKPGSV